MKTWCSSELAGLSGICIPPISSLVNVKVSNGLRANQVHFAGKHGLYNPLWSRSHQDFAWTMHFMNCMIASEGTTWLQNDFGQRNDPCTPLGTNFPGSWVGMAEQNVLSQLQPARQASLSFMANGKANVIAHCLEAQGSQTHRKGRHFVRCPDDEIDLPKDLP